MDKFAACFSDLPDPRGRNKRHPLLSILFIAIAAIACGAEGCVDMADFGVARRKWLRQIVPLPHGIPSHDTFSQVFRFLDPDAFAAAFGRFAAAFGASLDGVVAVDGKALRGAFRRGHKTTPLHLVNVWAAGAGLSIGQHLAPGRNEVQGVLDALALLSLEDCLVTADALHCRPDTARAILARGADYALALKSNQARLLAQAVACIEAADDPDRAQTSREIAHNRRELRRATVVPTCDLPFPGVQAVGCLEALRQEADSPETHSARYILLSSPLPAKALIEIARTHWTIENQLHWVLDVHFREDAARNRKDHGPQNIALLRKIALNLIRSHPDKASIRRKIKRAAWDQTFLNQTIANMR